MKIAILDDYQDCVRQLDCFALLHEHQVKIFTNNARGIGQLVIRLADFDALVLIRERTPLSRQLLLKLPKLKLIAQTGKAGEHIDIAAATERGIAITEGIGDPTAPAELTWALIMASQRKILPYASNLQSAAWQNVSSIAERNLLGTGLKDKVLGIWGYGRIGRLVAGYGKAFGMRVMIWGSDQSRTQALHDGYHVAATKEAFFSDADVLSVHLRLNEITKGIICHDDLARMKPTALFVNTSRAELLTPAALETALQEGHPGYAALDVFETEPLPINSPLLRMHNVLATPHIGYVEKDSYELYFRAAFENIVAFAHGTPKSVLNPGALNK